MCVKHYKWISKIDLEADMYGVLMDTMEAHGLQQYEISNFAHEGFRSTHNTIYWDNDEYAGFGAGAHGYLQGVRYSNVAPIKKYIDTVMDGKRPLLHEHEVTLEEKLEEQMFLGLRKTVGVTHEQFEKKFNQPMLSLYKEIIYQLQQDELIEFDALGIRLTRKGRFIGNEVFQRFLVGE